MFFFVGEMMEKIQKRELWRRFLPTFIKFMHKLAVLEGFSFSRLTRMPYGKKNTMIECCRIYNIIIPLLSIKKHRRSIYSVQNRPEQHA